MYQFDNNNKNTIFLIYDYNYIIYFILYYLNKILIILYLLIFNYFQYTRILKYRIKKNKCL